MSRRLRSIWAVLTSLLIVASGCHPQQPFYLFEDGDLSHYVDKATQIEYPDALTTSLADVENTASGFSLGRGFFANLRVSAFASTKCCGREAPG